MNDDAARDLSRELLDESGRCPTSALLEACKRIVELQHRVAELNDEAEQMHCRIYELTAELNCDG